MVGHAGGELHDKAAVRRPKHCDAGVVHGRGLLRVWQWRQRQHWRGRQRGHRRESGNGWRGGQQRRSGLGRRCHREHRRSRHGADAAPDGAAPRPTARLLTCTAMPRRRPTDCRVAQIMIITLTHRLSHRATPCCATGCRAVASRSASTQTSRSPRPRCRYRIGDRVQHRRISAAPHEAARHHHPYCLLENGAFRS